MGLFYPRSAYQDIYTDTDGSPFRLQDGPLPRTARATITTRYLATNLKDGIIFIHEFIVTKTGLPGIVGK